MVPDLMFLEKRPGPSYWFRNDRAEELRHLSLLQTAEILARLAGINTRPKQETKHGS